MIVRLSSVDVCFAEREALRSINLTVGAGERVALLGHSGAGKSTLLRLLNGLVRPSRGTVEVFGTDIATLSPGALRATRAQVAFVPQGFDLPGSLRVVHNVNAGRLGEWSTWKALASLVRPIDLARVDAALDAVDLGGYTWRRTDELSGGEQQRVALARALVQRPRLLLADEPISSLDPALAAHSLRLMTNTMQASSPRVGAARDVPSGTPGDIHAEDHTTSTVEAIVASLHSPALALQFFNRVVGLRDGSIVFDHTPEDVTPHDLDAIYATESPTP